MRASSHAVGILQTGPYPDWDQVPLDAVFTMRRYFEAEDKADLLPPVL